MRETPADATAPGDPRLPRVVVQPRARLAFGVLASGLLVVGVLALLAFAFLTPDGRALVGVTGLAPLVAPWIGFVLLLVAAACAALAIVRGVAPAQQLVGRSEVLRLGVFHGFLCGAASTIAAFFLGGAAPDLLGVLAWTFSLGFPFSAGLLVPLYLQCFERADSEHEGA